MKLQIMSPVADRVDFKVPLAPSVNAGLPSPGKASGGDGHGGDPSFLNGNHVVGKPRRAAPSMGGCPHHGVDLLGDQRPPKLCQGLAILR